MADVQIQLPNVGALPKEWVVPGALSILLKCIQADFDGSGAAGAFLPTVEIVSDAGLLVGRAFTDASVAAGGSASVTFAPFLEGQVAAGSSFAPLKAIYQSTNAVIAPGGVATNMSWTFAAGTALFDLTTPTTPKALAHGVYWIGVSFRGNAAWTAGKGLQGYLNTPFGVAQAFAIADSNVQLPQGFVGAVVELAAGQSISFGLANLDVANRTVYIQEADVVQFAAL